MQKVFLVIQDREQDAALTKLREVGVLHLERRSVSSDALSRALERKTKGDNAMALIGPYKASTKKSASANVQSANHYGRRESDMADPEKEPYSLDALNVTARPDLIDLLTGWGKDKKNLEDRLAFLGRERKRIQNWGNFDPQAIKDLASSGVVLYLYEITPSAFAALKAEAAASEDIRYILLGEDKNAVCLLALDKEIPGFTPFSLPEKSLAELDREAAELPGQIEAIEKRLASFADRMPVLKREIAEIQGAIEFETARSSMEGIEDIPGEYALSSITGYMPKEDVGLVKRAAVENHWALIADDPAPDDEVPTKLRNNKLASLIYPLTDFLETVPGYNEIDVSGFFLFFFVIFFGMIFGDAGYGALILLTCLIGMLRTAKKGVPPILKLLLLLGLSNFIWGMLTCSWFGLKTTQIPEVLRNLSLPLISNVTADRSDFDKAIVQQHLMIFCFSLALLQLSIGHILAIVHDKSLRILAHIGSIAMLGGMYFIILALIASNEARQIPLFPAAIYVFAGGFALNFVFAGYEGNIGRSILESFKNIISVILGIANIFSDIMSYIRLWAVGLAGAAIADTVDTMALQIGGIAGPVVVHFVVFIFAVVLLVFGHGLNLVLNVLSVLVHGVRLNTLEFSGHVGLTWAGTAYRPFAKRAIRSGE
jgi:V/A-type H+-transporting ATPase subunit I